MPLHLNLKKPELDEIDAHDVRDEYILYNSHASTHRYQIAEDEAFYLGNQLTTAQKDYLLSVGQPPESNNKIRPAVEQVLANVASGSPEWDIHPVGKLDNQLAGIYNALYDKIWYDSNGDVQFRKAAKDFIVKGHGYFYVYPDWMCDNGLGGVRFKHIPVEAVYVDPNSSLPDFSDASSIIYSDLHTKKHILSLFPQYASLIDEAQEDYYLNEISSDKYSRDDVESRADMSQDNQPKMRKFIRWSKVSVPTALVTDMLTGKVQTFDADSYKELTEDKQFFKLLKDGVLSEELVYEEHIREIFVLGDVLAYDEILPISRYPIVPACNEHVGTPYPAGDVRHAKSPQRMLNRNEALLISHVSSSTNFKLVVEDGAIEPAELQKWSVPNAIIRANPGALTSGKIKEFAPPALSSQLYSEKSRYELDIEQVFGAYKYLQGYAGESPGTVGEAQIVDEAVGRKQNWKVMPLYDMLTIAGKVVMEWIPYVYNQQRVVRLVSETGQRQDVTMNQPAQDPITGEIIRLYDMVTSQMDVRVVIGSTRAKSPMAELQKDLMLMNSGIYDREEVIMNMKGDVDKQSLIQRHGEISQLSQQVQGLTEELKKLSGDLQTRERELFHSNMRAEVSEATKPVAQAVSSVKASAKLEQARQRDKTRQAAEDVDAVLGAINSKPRASA
tara:strand:+ start:3056 stop:5068 length:2013 start_codon:yes stop_codon:yes gene_type:complete